MLHFPPILSFPLVTSRIQDTTEVGFMVCFWQTPPFTACWLVKRGDGEGDRCGPLSSHGLNVKPSCCCKHTSPMVLVNCTILWKSPQPQPAPPPPASNCQGFTRIRHCPPPCSVALQSGLEALSTSNEGHALLDSSPLRNQCVVRPT